MKMLMEIDPLSMRGSLVMTMASISPSRREVSPTEQLRRSPRLVMPRFRFKTAALRPESFLLIFFRSKHTIVQDGHRRPDRGPQGRGRAQGMITHRCRGSQQLSRVKYNPNLLIRHKGSQRIFLSISN